MIWDYAKRSNSRVLLYLKKNGLNIDLRKLSEIYHLKIIIKFIEVKGIRKQRIDIKS